MKNNIFIRNVSIALIVSLGCSVAAWAQTEQTDTVLTRNVVVEKDYQPVIQPAKKVNIVPKQVQTHLEPATVTYSDYSEPLKHVFNLHTLTASGIRFVEPNINQGWLEVGGGYPATHLDFGYRLQAPKDVRINLFAQHDAEWGARTWAKSRVGMDFLKAFSALNLYFDLDGNNTFYTRYGRYYDGDKKLSAKYSDLRRADKQHLWDVNVNVGVKAKKGEAIQYRAQTGYTAFVLPSHTAEHIIRTHVDVYWQDDTQKAGAKLYVQNSFFSVDKSLQPDTLSYTSRHAIRFEPFYEYNSTNWFVHAGVNVNLNVGRGKLLSSNDNVSFAPSPNVQVEYRVIPTLLALHADAKGQFGYGTLKEFMTANPYRNPIRGLVSRHVTPYTPVDAGLGIKIRPVNTLYLDIYARYAVLNNQLTMCTPTLAQLQADKDTYLGYMYSRYDRWTVGLQLLYHYQDIVTLRLDGHYYHWSQLDMENTQGEVYDTKKVYDRPAWDANLRVDVNINRQWSLYSDNHIAGSRTALLTDGSEEKLKPLVELNLGVKYKINSWMQVYAQLNNFIHRYNDLYYGYQTQGINAQVGFRWNF